MKRFVSLLIIAVALLALGNIAGHQSTAKAGAADHGADRGNGKY